MIKKAQDLVAEKYKPNTNIIKKYFDETERKFYSYLKENFKKQTSYLERAISFERTVER